MVSTVILLAKNFYICNICVSLSRVMPPFLKQGLLLVFTANILEDKGLQPPPGCTQPLQLALLLAWCGQVVLIGGVVQCDH